MHDLFHSFIDFLMIEIPQLLSYQILQLINQQQRKILINSGEEHVSQFYLFILFQNLLSFNHHFFEVNIKFFCILNIGNQINYKAIKKLYKFIMLLKTRVQVKLANKYDKIFHFCPTFNDTYVLLGIKHHRTEVLSHLNSAGQVIKERLFHDSDLEQFLAISDRQIIILHVKDNLIIQWNLQTNDFVQVPFLFKDEQIMNTCELFVFHETMSFCIAQEGGLESNYFRLSYFHYPLQNGNEEPFMVFEDEQVWNYNHIVRKGNNHSMICWFQPQKDQQIIIKMFDFREDSGEMYRQYQLTEFDLKQKDREMEITLCEVWELKPNSMLLLCLTNQNLLENHNNYPNSNFVINLKQWTFRKANFTFPGKYQNQLIDNFYFGTTSMFRGYDFDKGKYINSPVYYINNLKQEIIATEEWSCSHKTKYQILPYCTNMLVECEYENGHVDSVVVMTKEIPSNQLISASFLHEIIQDCDEDLMLEAIKLIQMS